MHYYTLLYYYTLFYSILYTVLWRETRVWILWKLIDFIAELRKEKIDEIASYILFSTKNLFCFAYYKKPNQEIRN